MPEFLFWFLFPYLVSFSLVSEIVDLPELVFWFSAVVFKTVDSIRIFYVP
jgi:hypothetical protein